MSSEVFELASLAHASAQVSESGLLLGFGVLLLAVSTLVELRLKKPLTGNAPERRRDGTTFQRIRPIPDTRMSSGAFGFRRG